ncbi:MAG: hypothetical protein JSV62_10160 [Promethearchaeota archaeon]|nr:MAG: hypothetical protein JSV62_10160 [Candidatus Lokiarchaeota archaeon]
MTEDQSEPVEEVKEKEEKRKIRIVEQIDNRLAIQGQAYIKGQLKEALSLAYEIIELAKPEDLKSFIREQEDLIARIKKLLKEKEEKERERLRAEQERQRLEKMNKLKDELNQLEYSFNAGFLAQDYEKTEETLDKAKNLLSQLDDSDYAKKWLDFEHKHLKAKVRKELMADAQEIIEQSIKLKEKFLFDDIKLKLSSIITKLKENEISDYLQELEYIQNDILNAEKAYLDKVNKIEDINQEIKALQKDKKYELAISKCEELLKFAESINKTDIIEENSKLLMKLQKDHSFEELKELVKKLNNEGLLLLRKGDIKSSLEKFKTIKGSINFFLEES